jgi:hypothetical protein
MHTVLQSSLVAVVARMQLLARNTLPKTHTLGNTYAQQHFQQQLLVID